jgi:hypothetical protein
VSTNLAYAAPARSPRETPAEQQHPRRVEVISTRSQRRARPKVFYAVVTVAALFAVFGAQLFMSIVLADGAYQISSLQADQKELARTEEALSEKLDLLASPQNLASQAEALGMVMSNTTPQFLALSDGSVTGASGAAGAGSAGVLGVTGSLVPNALLDASGAATTQGGTIASTGTTATTVTSTTTATDGTTGEQASLTVGTGVGAPATNGTTGTVASVPGTLPSPVTH